MNIFSLTISGLITKGIYCAEGFLRLSEAILNDVAGDKYINP